MTKHFASCAFCGHSQEVIRESYDEHFEVISKWLKEEPDNEAAEDAFDDIKGYKDNKEAYLEFFYDCTPEVCEKCGEHYFFNHKENRSWIDFEYKDSGCCDLVEEGFGRIKKVNPAKGYVYFLRNIETGMIKIGCSKNPESRKKQIETTYDIKTELIHVIDAEDENKMYEIENNIHKLLEAHRYKREWFSLPENLVKALLAEGKTYQYIKEVLADISGGAK